MTRLRADVYWGGICIILFLHVYFRRTIHNCLRRNYIGVVLAVSLYVSNS